MARLSEFFKIEYGNKFDMNKMIVDNSSNIAFVSRTEKNNGVAAFVNNYNSTKPYNKGLVTVALGGSILSSYVQPIDFYTAQNVAVLIPLNDLTLNEKLYYCWCIRRNKFRYSTCGREANKTLRDLIVPSKEEIPAWVNLTPIPELVDIQKSAIAQPVPDLWSREWKAFKYDELFEIQRGISKPIGQFDQYGKTPLISASTQNNGLVARVADSPIFNGNSITIANSGQGSVGFTCYQPEPFIATQNVTVLTPKLKMDIFTSMFLTTILNMERFRWSYGRVLSTDRLKCSTIKLPVDSLGNLDLEFMGNYIKTLKYSSNMSA